MDKPNANQNGHFCWNQIATSDIDKAIVFYSALFGWEIAKEDLDVEDQMVRMTHEGDFVVGIQRVDENNSPHWEPYVAISNLEAALTKAREAGGTVLEQPTDITPYGYMAEVADPVGIKTALWTADSFAGHGRRPRLNVPRWYTLHHPSSDYEDGGSDNSALDFWAKLFDWSLIEKSAEHTLFGGIDGAAFSSIVLPTETRPPHRGWIVFVAVEDLERTCQDAMAIDATVVVAPHRLEGLGQFAVLDDPQGATFGLVCLD